jgi:hypothetical protein
MSGSVALRMHAVIAGVFVLLVACSDSGGDDAAADGSGGASANNGSSGAGGSTHVVGNGGSSGHGTDHGASGSGGQASGSGGHHAGSGGSSASGSGGTGSGGAGHANSGGALPQIGGCDMFTADDAWNRDISGEDADPAWTAKLHALVGDANIHPDYGNSGAEHYGIPINTVPEKQALVAVEFDAYPEESDPGPWPLPDPSDAKIEGGSPESCDGDCHFNVVQSGACMLFEGYACSYAGGWRCANGAKWDLTKNSYGQRPKGWTSADAAGLAITPGVLRYDEVHSGEVKHAIRFTVECTKPNFVAPASHLAVPPDCDESDPNAPPMGLRVRLKNDYDISGLSASAKVVARAMQTYGMILADNGSNFFFQGEDNPGWTEDDVEPLKSIPASAFEALVPPALEN